MLLGQLVLQLPVYMNVQVVNELHKRVLDVWSSSFSSVIDAMVNDTVRVYLTMIKRLMNYKESKTPDGISSGSIVKKK